MQIFSNKFSTSYTLKLIIAINCKTNGMNSQRDRKTLKQTVLQRRNQRSSF